MYYWTIKINEKYVKVVAETIDDAIAYARTLHEGPVTYVDAEEVEVLNN